MTAALKLHVPPFDRSSPSAAFPFLSEPSPLPALLIALLLALSPCSFEPAAKVPASCTGPTVTISLVPKVCTLESATKQVVCDPAKLVLTKSPGSCTHKYLSASTWTGKVRHLPTD
jgi:hypothetical protein